MWSEMSWIEGKSVDLEVVCDCLRRGTCKIIGKRNKAMIWFVQRVTGYMLYSNYD